MLTFTSAQLAGWIGSFMLPFLRVLALLIAMPVLNHRSLPMRVRITLAASIGLLVAPLLPPLPPDVFDGPTLFALIVQQLVIGLGLGFSIRLAFAAFELAGELIGLQTGLGFSQFIDPVNGRQQPILGSLLMLLGSLLFLTLDGHLLAIESLITSFRTLPIDPTPKGLPAAQAIIKLGGLVFMQGLQLALPVIGAMLLTNLAFGLLSRAAPSLNLMSIGFPLTLAIGFWMLMLALPSMGVTMVQNLQRAVVMP